MLFLISAPSSSALMYAQSYCKSDQHSQRCTESAVAVAEQRTDRHADTHSNTHPVYYVIVLGRFTFALFDCRTHAKESNEQSE